MSPVLISVDGDGCRFGLRVVPGAKHDAINGAYGERLRLRVRAVPEKGRANRAVIELLATCLDISTDRIEIVAGHASRDKVVRVAGLAPDRAHALLTNASE